MKRLMLPVAGILAACAPVHEATANAGPYVAEQVWGLRELQGKRVPGRPSRTATLRFNRHGAISGTWVCNSVGEGRLRWTAAPGQAQGGINADGQGVAIITLVGCRNPNANAVAEHFWHLMDTARIWSIDRKGLSIGFADGSSARLVAVHP